MRRQWLISLLSAGALLLGAGVSRAQFTDCMSGLLQMPTADFREAGTGMVTVNGLNPHTNSTRWDYYTFNYGVGIAFFNRLEVAYVCTHMSGESIRKIGGEKIAVSLFNQDRHFAAKVQLLKEEEFGWKWLPALALGVSDPTTASGGGYETGVGTSGNGYFNRYYAVLSKHFTTPWGTVGAHAGYLYNQRKDYPLNGPCAGAEWRPVWLQTPWLDLNLIAEYDARTFNLGFTATLWDHVGLMLDLQALRWVSCGIRYTFLM